MVRSGQSLVTRVQSEARAADLADYFHEQVEYFGMYYDQDGNEDWFQQYISEEAIKFIRN